MKLICRHKNGRKNEKNDHIVIRYVLMSLRKHLYMTHHLFYQQYRR